MRKRGIAAKKTKRNDRLLTDIFSVELELNEAKRKKRNSIIWIVVYTVLILGCCILWSQSKLSVFGLIDCVALIGCAMAAVVLIGIAISLFLFLYDKQMRALEFYTDTDWLIVNVVSFLGTAIAICLPCGIIWILVENIEPLHVWLTTPIYSVLRYKGLRLAGCILVAIPYLLLWTKYSKNKKRIPLYTQLLNNLREQQELVDLEEAKSYDPTKSKSWEKMKAQRRAAEKRKASLRHDNENGNEINSDDEILFL